MPEFCQGIYTVQNSFTEVCTSTSMLEKSSVFGISFPWPPIPSGAPVPWIASNVPGAWLEPTLVQLCTKPIEIAFLPVLFAWPIAKEVHHSHIGIWRPGWLLGINGSIWLWDPSVAELIVSSDVFSKLCVRETGLSQGPSASGWFIHSANTDVGNTARRLDLETKLSCTDYVVFVNLREPKSALLPMLQGWSDVTLWMMLYSCKTFSEFVKFFFSV